MNGTVNGDLKRKTVLIRGYILILARVWRLLLQSSKNKKNKKKTGF